LLNGNMLVVFDTFALLSNCLPMDELFLNEISYLRSTQPSLLIPLCLGTASTNKRW